MNTPLDTERLEHSITNGKGFEPPAKTSVAEAIAEESRAPIDKLCSQMLGVIDEKIAELKKAKTLIERERAHFHHRLDGIVGLSNTLALCVIDTQRRLAEIGEFTAFTPTHEEKPGAQAHDVCSKCGATWYTPGATLPCPVCTAPSE